MKEICNTRRNGKVKDEIIIGDELTLNKQEVTLFNLSICVENVTVE